MQTSEMNTRPDLPGVKVVRVPQMQDERGWFYKPFASAALGVDFQVEETFFSSSKRGVLRGLHFQTPPFDHHKVVICLKGRALDVLVDLRVGSPAYGQPWSMELQGPSSAILIPKGLAHGFLALEDDTTMVYWVDRGYAPTHDHGILWNSIDFDWPLGEPDTSLRDRAFPALSEFVSPFVFASSDAKQNPLPHCERSPQPPLHALIASRR
jgi:dTDP-4-dehydrorhamnose 3,5-epimerase